MAKRRKASMFGGMNRPKRSPPGTLKDELNTRAKELIETVLKPKHVKSPPKGHQFTYLAHVRFSAL
jgi:hypothetical protein